MTTPDSPARSGRPDSPPPPPTPPRHFLLFPSLPAELRLKIWHLALALAPRTVELHARKTHYADDASRPAGGVPKWQSRSRNPALLGTSAEARAAALDSLTVAFPLAGAGPRSSPVLYLAPERDTLVVLGELSVQRMVALLGFLRKKDARGVGLRRLGVGAGCFAVHGGATILRVYSRSIFQKLDELVLFMYNERIPPDDWGMAAPGGKEGGGECALVECRGTDHYRRFELGRGAELKDGEAWMRVGRRDAELRVMDLVFEGTSEGPAAKVKESDVWKDLFKTWKPFS